MYQQQHHCCFYCYRQKQYHTSWMLGKNMHFAALMCPLWSSGSWGGKWISFTKIAVITSVYEMRNLLNVEWTAGPGLCVRVWQTRVLQLALCSTQAHNGSCGIEKDELLYLAVDYSPIDCTNINDILFFVVVNYLASHWGSSKSLSLPLLHGSMRTDDPELAELNISSDVLKTDTLILLFEGLRSNSH